MAANEILRRFDEGFSTIVKQTTVTYTTDFGTQSKLDKIIDATNRASKERYLTSNDHEAILARLIMQIYSVTDTPAEVFHKSDSFFEILTNSKETELDKIFNGFEFYDNNPYREIAERRLEKIKKRRDRGLR